ncbi:MAG: hypothetical protein RIC55_34075 [Pirellulaceae bacterium]
MTSVEETQHRLRELIEGRLSPGEAEELHQRITSEPEVARAYAEAVLERDRVTQLNACCDHTGEPNGGEDCGHRPSMFHRLCRIFGSER